MSGAAFEGLEGAVPAAEGESYTPGSANYAGSVAAIVEFHLDWVERNHQNVLTNHKVLWDDRERRLYLRGIIEKARGSSEEEAFNAQGFLDAVVGGLALADPEQSQVAVSDLLQVLYGLGYDGLVLDTTRLSGESYIPFGLKGDERRPLNLTCICGADASVGNTSSYCSITVPHSVREVGHFSKHSTYRVDGDARIGPHPKDCDFYMHSFDAVGFGDLVLFSPEDCNFYLEKEPSPERLARFAEVDEGRLVYKGNKVYAADGEGDWKDITPALPKGVRNPFSHYIKKGEQFDEPPWWRRLFGALGGKKEERR